MKAVILKDFGGIENFDLVEVDRPIPKDDEVLIRIRATAFNPIDYQMRQGASESKLLKSPILGREFAGEIIELGHAVTGFAIGDKVSAYVGSLASNGTYAEFISVPAALLAKVPGSVNFEQAAALPMVGLTALQCFNRLGLSRDTVVFIAGGAGGVGTILIKLLLANGVHNIYTTSGSSDSTQHLLNMGIEQNKILHYRNADVATMLKSSNENFHYVIDLVGGAMSETCAEIVAIFGTYVDVTFLSTPKAREILFDKATTLLNVANYAPSLGAGPEKYAYYGKALQELFELVDKTILTPTEVKVVGNLSVACVQKAHLLMEQNETKGKKLVMTIH